MFADKSTSVKNRFEVRPLDFWSKRRWTKRELLESKAEWIIFLLLEELYRTGFFYRCALMFKFMFGLRKAQIYEKSVSKHLLGPLELLIPLIIVPSCWQKHEHWSDTRIWVLCQLDQVLHLASCAEICQWKNLCWMRMDIPFGLIQEIKFFVSFEAPLNKSVICQLIWNKVKWRTLLRGKA